MDCATFITLMKGTKCNWDEELLLRMQKEVGKQRDLRPSPLLCVGYMGVLCQLWGASNPSSYSRLVPTIFELP